jgi:hypothetical protein
MFVPSNDQRLGTQLLNGSDQRGDPRASEPVHPIRGDQMHDGTVFAVFNKQLIGN